jgi:hypothetical protein
MLRASVIALLAAAATAVVAAPASADTVTCAPGEYLLIRGENPRIADLRAHNLPRKTDGYAPRCLVAEVIAADVQRALQNGEKPPRTVIAWGARWSGGKWRCSYPDEERVACRKKLKPKRRITFRLV